MWGSPLLSPAPLLVQAALQATHIGDLAQVLIFFTNQLPEHARNGEIIGEWPGANLRKGNTAGMDVERSVIKPLQVRHGRLPYGVEVSL
jgi:hypothetical protein